MNIRAIAEKTGMDYEAVMEDYCGDVSILKEKIMAFPASADLSQLEKSIKEGDTDGVRKEAHRIRKAAEKLGMKELARLASLLEEVDGEKAKTDFEELRAARDSICAVIGAAE